MGRAADLTLRPTHKKNGIYQVAFGLPYQIALDGEIGTVAAWAHELDLDRNLITSRINAGHTDPYVILRKTQKWGHLVGVVA